MFNYFRSQLLKLHTWIMSTMLVLVSPIMAQSDTISIDTGTFITEINNWIGVAIAIVAIGVGISAAFALAQYVGNMFVSAFSGRRM